MFFVHVIRGGFITACATFAFSTAGFANQHVSETQKWATPNVIGMPGYTPQIAKSTEQGQKPAVRQAIANWDVISGSWKQFSGKVKEQWGRLTDDELVQINGKREGLEGMLQQRYGFTPNEAKGEVDKWISHN